MADPKLDIKIQAHVEIGEMRKMEDALQREIVQMPEGSAAGPGKKQNGQDGPENERTKSNGYDL